MSHENPNYIENDGRRKLFKKVAINLSVAIVGTVAGGLILDEIVQHQNNQSPTISNQNPTSTPTESSTPHSQPTKTPEPTPTRKPEPTATKESIPANGAFVDLGNPQSENGHNVIGWAGTNTNQPPSPSGDTTFRYQPRGSKGLVTLFVAQAGMPYTLTTEVQDFGCDDSFEIFVNNDSAPIYRFSGTRANIVRVHTVPIPANEITSQNVTLGFESTSSDCGAAGVYNVRLTSS